MSKSGVACYRNGGCGPYEMYSCSECPASKSDYVQFRRKPVTNYDRIVHKTPEELAEYFRVVVDCEFCPVTASTRECTDGKYCMEQWLDWLKQEAGE